MHAKHKWLSLADATLLSCLTFASSRAFGQAVKIPGLINPIIPFQQVSAPVFMPPPGIYTGPQVVTITSATSGVSIRYVVSTGTTTPPPTPASGTLYSGPVVVAMPGYVYTVEVRAIAYSGYINLTPSVVTVGYYTIVPPWWLPRRP